MGRTLLDKIWDAHTVRTEDGGRSVLYIDRQYIHEVTSPVAFAGLERRGIGVARPAQITATADHNIPTVAAPGRGAGGQLRQIRHRTFRRGKPAPGHRAHHRPRTGIHTAGHDHRLRRQPHLDARGTGRRGIRRRHLRGRDGLRQPVHHPVQAAEHAHHGRRDTAPGRRSQGCRALHHLATPLRAARATSSSSPAKRSDRSRWKGA